MAHKKETLKTLQPAVGIDLLQGGAGGDTPTPTPSPERTPSPSITNNVPAVRTKAPASIFDREAFSKRLEDIRQQTLAIQAKASQVRKNETTDLSDVVSSSADQVQGEKDVQTDIIRAREPRAVDTSGKELLQDFISSLEKRRAEEVANIEAQFAVQKEKQEGAQKREVGTTATTLARLGGFLGGSGSGTGVLINLAKTHEQEMITLDGKRQAAISAAESAIDDKQFAAAQSLAAEIKSIDKEIDKRRNEFFDQSLDLIKEDRQKGTTLRDDARASITTMLNNFGGFDFETLDETIISQLSDLAEVAQIPLATLSGPTIKQTTSENTERNNKIRNAISAANLAISQAKFAESQRLSSLDAQRLGLPRQTVGLNESAVTKQLQGEAVPAWFLESVQQKPNPPKTQVELESRWESFRNEILTTTPLFNFGSIGGARAISDTVVEDLSG